MASIRKIEGKHGTTYKITVTLGRDSIDRQIGKTDVRERIEPGVTASSDRV